MVAFPVGQRSTTANADETGSELGTTTTTTTTTTAQPSLPQPDESLQQHSVGSNTDLETPNVIPTSPQYGVAIIGDLTAETMVSGVETGVETKTDDVLSKDALHSTPSRNDRFKVVKIASLEPFKRGRWKCMDYMDEAPPPPVKSTSQAPVASATTQGTTVYLQTQSLPQQQIQQMLLQGGQYYQPMVPQTQYFYGSAPPPGQYPTQTYFAPVPNSAYTLPTAATFQNVQYVPANLIQTNQGSAFVPTSFQQSQTYGGPPPNVNQPMVNGHAYPAQTNEQQQQQQPQQVNSTATIPTQPVKSIILTNHQQQATPPPQPATNNQSQTAVQNQSSFQQATQQQQVATNDALDNNPTNVYTNPQFDMNVNSLTTVLEGEGGQGAVGGGGENNESGAGTANPETSLDNPDEQTKNNPVVNAIDNKIELAMDLVKSHLMYTVREEVEVLKEKIAELMEKIQQLETENNYLRSQIPKNGQVAPPASTAVVTPAVTMTTTTVAAAAAAGATTTPAATTPAQQPMAPPSDNGVP